MSSSKWPVREGEKEANLSVLEEETNGHGHVYFLGSPDEKEIRIGWSGAKDWERIDTHREGDAFGKGGDFIILALVRANQGTERRIHDYFASVRIPNRRKKEVYYAETIIPYVTWLRNQYYVSTTREEFYSARGNVTLPPDVWFPDSTKIETQRNDIPAGAAAMFEPWTFLPTRDITGDDWYTPPEYVKAVRAALGGVIDLDPASHVYANEEVKAKKFYTRSQNGLLHPFYGHVYLNPPFSEWNDWAKKVLREVDNIEDIVMLGAIRTLSAEYFNPLLQRTDAICIITGRIGFWGLKTKSNSPTDGHFLLYIGKEVTRFANAVQHLGTVWIKKRGDTL